MAAAGLALALVTAVFAGTASANQGAITPEFAKALFEQVRAIEEPDGCRLARFDTVRFSINVGLHTAAGMQDSFELTSASSTDAGERTAAGWALSVPLTLERECPATLAAIERVLESMSTPIAAPWRGDRWTAIRANYPLLASCFAILTVWSCLVLYRQWRSTPPPPSAVAALAAIWLAALALRLFLSPHTFLHEYYHIAETLYGHLHGKAGPVYGDTGPALFQLAGRLTGHPDDARVIFATNALLASLAIPAAALFDLAVMASWPRALCAAALLAVLPHHLRFSASEVLFVQSVTFGLWTLALFALYVRTRRLAHALPAVLALALAMQTRPEMLLFPAALVGLVVLSEPRSWRVLFDRNTWIALLVLMVLLVPRILELQQVAHGSSQAAPALPELRRYTSSMILFDEAVTPSIYLPIIAAGLLATLVLKPGYALWSLAVYAGFTLFSLSLFDNPPYNLRSQLLPTSFLVVAGAGVASLWTALCTRRRRLGTVIGTGALLLLSVAIVIQSRPFVTRLADQQLEWQFLERAVPQLPESATLLAVVEVGGRNLDAFPDFLLQRANKRIRLVDLRNALDGSAPWPEPGDDLLFYRGMFCYFAFPDQPPPTPMTDICAAVLDRYQAEPVIVEDLDTVGYSAMNYAEPPYRIGFYRLSARKPQEVESPPKKQNRR